MVEQTPRTGFNFLLMVEALIAIGVVLAGVVWAWSSVERRVTALEEAQHRDAQQQDAKRRDQRIERIEQAIEEQGRTLKQMTPRK
jgi:HAMP domain-containing protein